MKILKFGGTSVGSIDNMRKVAQIINDGEKKIVVLSAMSGTTNKLVEIARLINNKEEKKATQLTRELYRFYLKVAEEFYHNATIKQTVKVYIENIFENVLNLIKNPNNNVYNLTVANGELLSTFIFTQYLIEMGFDAQLIPALDFMRIDRQHEPDEFYIKQNLNRLIRNNLPATIYITQGFICLDEQGLVANLERGGSDYSATIIGAAIEVDEVEIWTDIDGMHNNDPRYVENTHAIAHLSYEEAAELAYFGARILHPQTVMPARKYNIPVRLKYTLKPELPGTLINSEVIDAGIKAIAAKDGITAIKIKSARMLLAYGFLKKVFEIFEKYETPIDMITTSEIAVSLTIDSEENLSQIVKELNKFATVEVDANQSIICLVGHHIVNHPDSYKLFNVLHDYTVRMISYGGSNNNISLLVSESNKKEVLKKLNEYIFDHKILA
ncbi:MAG: aspartate kinase [Lutibacter sp.]